jgi:2-dehydropantoate 2-reductase
MSWTFESVAVVGAGAVGLYYGGRLAVAGTDVRFLVRSDFGALSQHGLHVESVHGDFSLPQPQVFKSSADIGPVDLVIVAWKTTANSQLVSVLPPLLHQDTQVLTLQNGLGNCELISSITGPERVLGGQCFVCLNRDEPGFVKHLGGGRVTLGEWRPGVTGRAADIARRFQQAGVPATAVPDLEQAQWEKLVWNIPFNGLSVAAGGVTTDALLASSATEAEIRALMHETVAAARALGHLVDPSIIDLQIDRTRPMGPYRTSSMIDFVEGREVEVDSIWREPLLRGTAAGVSMPHLTELLIRIEERIESRNAG